MAQTLYELIDGVTEAMLGDPERLRPLLDDDVLVLGTDPGEEFEGPDAVVRAMAEQAGAIGAGRWTSEGDRRLRERGDVAWWAEHGRLEFGQGGSRVRITGVAVKGEQGWRLAQGQVAPCQAAASFEPSS
jgi:ketosteroid isomerase-like protein